MNSAASRGVVRITDVIVASAILFCLTATPVFSDIDARKILEGVYEQDTSRDTSMKAVFEIFDPAEIRGVTLLSYNHKGDTDRQWLYIPATQRTRSVTPRERSEKFAGTDFTYEDVEERVLDDFHYRLVSENETIDGHKTYKVEAKPVDEGRSQYGHIYYWVGQDVPVILHAEMYDRDGKLVRELHASALKRVSGIWGARHVEMRSVAEKTRTVLTVDEAKFNQHLDEKLFTADSLENTPSPTKHVAPR
jgi:hypothetical protein